MRLGRQATSEEDSQSEVVEDVDTSHGSESQQSFWSNRWRIVALQFLFCMVLEELFWQLLKKLLRLQFL